jgi:hypothetical protein
MLAVLESAIEGRRYIGNFIILLLTNTGYKSYQDLPGRLQGDVSIGNLMVNKTRTVLLGSYS